MEARELLRYLEKLEIGLSSFSYEELGTVEAGELKKSFEIFKNGLENKVFGISEMEQLQVIYDHVGIEGSTGQDEDSVVTDLDKTEQLLKLIETLEKTDLSQVQKGIINELKLMGEELQSSLSNTDDIDKEKALESNFSTQKVNLKPVLEECLGQMELLEEFVKIYKLNIMEFIGGMKIHLQLEDFKAIRVCCQKVIPSLRMMNTIELLNILQQIDVTCKNDKDVKYLEFLYQQFLNEYPNVEALVDFEIKALKEM
ncbi:MULTISPECIES: hypothetical protein [Flavobacteriaceae]|uniref:hypothetical protein n=1 Tax=Flavobacteriaceae TaxID=49546 RepID=UPI0014911B61|nr:MULTISPECIES: hypothetical protein [Allomuricauda]MDC6364639.1 hypothetical protein [Muricauda sp. AC10]